MIDIIIDSIVDSKKCVLYTVSLLLGSPFLSKLFNHNYDINIIVSDIAMLQVDFLVPVYLTGVTTQGQADGPSLVTSYKVQHSRDGVTWSTYREHFGVDKVRAFSITLHLSDLCSISLGVCSCLGTHALVVDASHFLLISYVQNNVITKRFNCLKQGPLCRETESRQTL